MPNVTHLGDGKARARNRFPNAMAFLFPIHFALHPRVVLSEAQAIPFLGLRVPEATLLFSEQLVT